MVDGTFPSTCWECGTICGSLATVKDGRVAEVGPNAEHPATRGAFCVNVNAAMSYDGPWDPISGSADTRGMRCRLIPVPT